MKDRKAPAQNAEELASLIDFAREKGVRSYLEIGARHGGCFDAVVRSLPQCSSAIAVDLPGGLWGTQRSEPYLRDVCQQLRVRMYKVKAIFANSQAPETVEAVKALHPKFDLILIDGDHTLKGVTRDWDNYRAMGRYIAFHDIVGEGQREKVSSRLVEVPQLWQRLKREFPDSHYEFVAEGSAMGIGIIDTGAA